MARPSKYDWETIEPMLRAGRTPKYINEKFGVPFNAISNFVKKNNIRVNEVVNEVTNSIDRGVESIKNGINEVVNEVNEPDEVKKEMLDIVNEKIDTLIVDNKIIDRNRQIATYLQGVIIKEKNNINLKNIKNVSGVLKDIESIANPQASKADINIQNTNASQTVIKSLEDFYEG